MSNPGKRLPFLAALSALVIIAGIIVFALFGFNYQAAEVKTVEIGYDAVVTIADKEKDLQTVCENAFSAQGLKYKAKSLSTERDTTSVGETGEKLLTYTFASSVDEAKLQNAVTAIENAPKSGYEDADVYVSVHVAESSHLYEASWRGAIAIAVGAIVALVYVGFRFGVGSALTGLVVVVDDTLVTLALLALTRIPVYAYTPVLFAGLAAVFSLVLWIAQCAKMRENFKDPSYASLSAAEAVGESCRSSWKFVLWFVVPLAAVFAVLAVIMTVGTGVFPFPGLIPLAVSVYSSLLLAPAVLVPIKAKFDRMKAARSQRYVGKKKADVEE